MIVAFSRKWMGVSDSHIAGGENIILQVVVALKL